MTTMTNKPIVIVGEARSEYDERINSSFASPGGIELLRMLHDAKLITLTSVDREYINDYYRRGRPESINSIWRLHNEIFRTNVFAIHPPANRLEWFCGPKAEGIHSY